MDKKVITILTRTWKPEDIHFWKNPKDGNDNASVLFNGKLSRLRAGIIIMKGNQILLGEEKDEPGVFSLPGGSINKDEDIIDAAKREAEEEVGIIAKNIEETGIDYCECHDQVMDWVKENVPEDEWWYNYYTCLCIGEYDSEYKGKVGKADEDSSMKNSSKFYDLEDVIDDPSFKYAWKIALYNYGYLDKFPLDENVIFEKIVKKGSKWQVQSEKGRNMGTYDTKEKAEKRLQQVHYFKHMNEELAEDKIPEFLYHATYKPYLDEIKQEGKLCINPPHDNWGMNNDRCIYLAASKDMARSFAETSDYVPEEFLKEIIILKIPSNKLDLEYLELDPNIDLYFDPEGLEDFCYAYYKDIPFSAIEEIKESLNESSRTSLITKSKSADKYRNGKGSRWTQKSKCFVASTVKDYNKIDMDTFWKQDKLSFGIKVTGETNNYIVTISFKNILPKIQRKIKDNDNLLEFKCIYDALIQAINSGDVLVSCTCLHPDTKIKLLDGTTPTVKEMCERFEAGEKLYVYSTDKNGDFKPGEVEKVWMTKITKEFIKVTLDNGKEILTTPEHPYMLRNGSYILAQDLKEGTSLMPMYFNETNGYETIKLNTEVRGWHTTYKMVANYFKSTEIEEAELRAKPEDNMKYSVAIHHKDFNKKNNNPENLQIMTAKEHWKYHASLCGNNRPVTERMIETGRNNAIKRNANPTENMLKCRKVWQEKGKLRNYDLDRKEQQSKILTNTLNNYYASFTEEDWKNKAEKVSIETKERWKNGSFKTQKFHEARLREGKRLFNDPNHQLNMRKAKMKKVLQFLLDNNFELNEENYNKYRNKASKVEKVFNSFNDMIKEFNLNHKVIKVEKIILNETPVYDIKVKKWENFVVDAGVVLHNCPDYKYRIKYWNSQNGDEAGEKETRKADITNPNDTKGPACKHILAVLNNVEWLNKVASVINNYINYCKDNMQYNYSKYMFPKLYGIPYNKVVQMRLDDYDEEGNLKDTLKSDESTINLINALGKVRGRFKKGSNRNPAANKKDKE